MREELPQETYPRGDGGPSNCHLSIQNDSVQEYNALQSKGNKKYVIVQNFRMFETQVIKETHSIRSKLDFMGDILPIVTV